uniref:CCHC-type domain-containing protein n=1 Tax=Tanacetum cinerariifolium TaxID=118510 RepID=A0A6L2KX40_TANCI|nr:hypothetical protein [Tanacetum cinerariifolium]
MSSFNHQECLGCGQPCDGYHCYSCTCQQCGVILLNGICIYCIYEDRKSVTCCECEGPLRGGFCLFCNSKAENSFTYNPDSFNDTSSNFNHLPQPQYETYLCKLCGNNSHYGHDCPPQFPSVYEQELRYNQNYNDNYYPRDLPSFFCCDNCGGSHETFQCQPKDQNIDSSGFDQIQSPQYPVIHHPSQEMSFIARLGKKFAIQHAQPEDTNELVQKLLEDLHIINEELAEYINSPSWNRPTFYNNDEENSVQYKEYLQNSSNAITATNFNQEKEEPPQNSNIRQLIREECGIKVCEEQKQNMEDTLLELLEVCRQKEFYCMHNNVDDLIESALNSKLLSINLRSQRLDKKRQEVKKIVEQPTKRGIRIAESLQNFRVKKSSTSLNNTMGYEHPSTTPKTELDKVNKSSVEKLVPILREYEVTSENESKCDVPVCEDSTTFDVLEDHYEILSDSSNDDISIDDDAFEDIEYVEASLLDSELTFNDHTKETRSGSTTTHANNSLPEYDSFCFEIEPNQERLTSVVMKFISDNSTNDPLLEEVDLFLASDNSIPPGIENFDYDSEGDIHFLEELLVNDSIPFLKNKSSNFDHHDDPSFPRTPPKPPNVKFFFDFEPNSGEVISTVMNNINELNEDECFDTGGEINVFENVEDDDHFPVIFVIRIFLPYLIYPKVFPLLLSTGSEDTISDPGISA